MKFFQVVNIYDRNLSAIIEGIRLLANPFVKQSAHITIGGPFTTKVITKKILQEIEGDTEKIRNKEIIVGGVRNFFQFGQNTVYLPCFLESLKDVWKKSDFGFNPHLTLYDAGNRNFANKLYSELKKINLIFSFNIEKIDILKSVKNQANSDLISRANLLNNISYYLGTKIDYETIINLSEEERLNYIIKLYSYFINWNKVGAFPSPIQSLFTKIGVNEDNGLFYFSEIHKWGNKFPFRITKALKGIKPFAVFSLYKNLNEFYLDSHPKPFNQPLILFFDNPPKDEISIIHKQVFSFGLAPVIFFNFLDRIEIYNGLSFQDKKNQCLKLIGNEGNLDDFSFHNLFISERWKDFYSTTVIKNKRIDYYLLNNLTTARTILIDTLGLNPSITNRLIGRLLFTRYLIDRDIEFKQDQGKKVNYFLGSNREQRNLNFIETILVKESIYTFFSFLERKLGGELFPVTLHEIEHVEEKHLEVLYHLFKGERFYVNKRHGYQIQGSLFDVYDFKIIPIELISNIYESFMGNEKRVANKSFYTPPFLVDYILSQTVEPHLARNNNHPSCKVLDPSCGSGIFLIEAARKLIEKKIELSTRRKISDNEVWQLISENIFGIDIDPDAIDVAIFSLYVTILDYKEPKEISEKFKLKNLKGTNFFAGSDFFNLDDNYNKIVKNIKFDFIIGNPPWGKVQGSYYTKYCKNREQKERHELGSKALPIGLSDEQIAQAFLIRASDFMATNTECAFVVTSKILYNSYAKTWRSYFLNHFKVDEVMDLSAVR